MAMESKKAVLRRLAEKPIYVVAFKALFGINLCDPALYENETSINAAYAKMAQAIGEFERTRHARRLG
jgi:cytochrome c peroxidase